MELLHTQIQIEWPETFLILKTKRKRNAELSNSPVKNLQFATSYRENYLILKL